MKFSTRNFVICYLRFTHTTTYKSSTFPDDFPRWRKILPIDKCHIAETFLSPSIIIKRKSSHHCACINSYSSFSVILNHCLCGFFFIDSCILCRRERMLGPISWPNSSLGSYALPAWFICCDCGWIFASILYHSVLFSLMHCCVSQQRCLWDGHVMWDAMCLENIKNN